MSAPMRFVAGTLVAWVAVRAASLGLFPGMTALVPPADAGPAQAALLQSRPVEATAGYVEAAGAPPYAPPGYGAPTPPYAGPSPYFAASPYYVAPRIVLPAGWAGPRVIPVPVASPASAWNAVVPEAALDQWAEAEPLGLTDRPRAFPLPAPGPGPVAATPIAPAKLDRLQLSTWALLRQKPGALGLGNNGMLGGSQVGARLTYKFTPTIAASLRFSSSPGGVRGAEAAAGVRWQPLKSVPVALNLERRQAIGEFGGRSAFAAFAEGGLYQRPVWGRVMLDGYVQAGVVGLASRDWFADGAVTLTHPIWRRLSGGLGVWSAGQERLYRVDVGPRLSLDVGRGVRLHADYRYRLTGNAEPGSGPALTISGDF